MALLAYRRLRRVNEALFHWLMALPLLAWVGLLWTMNRPVSPQLGLLMLGMAWLTMALALGLRRLRWAYGLPWQVASLTASVLAFGLAFYGYEEVWTTWVVTGTAVYFLAAVWTFHSSRYFYVAGFLLPFAMLLILDWLLVRDRYWLPILALFPLAYVWGGIWLEKIRGRERPFTNPFYRMALVLAVPHVGHQSGVGGA